LHEAVSSVEEGKKKKKKKKSCVIIVSFSEQLSILTLDRRNHIHILFCFTIPERSSDKSSTTYLRKSWCSGYYEV